MNKTLPSPRLRPSRVSPAAWALAAAAGHVASSWRQLDLRLPTSWLKMLLCLATAWAAAPTRAAGPAEPAGLALGAPLTLQVRQLLLDKLTPAGGAAAAGAPRVEITLGHLDPRLQLAPCQKVDAYLPQGARLWGRARVGLRCVDGPRRWNVYLPVTVTHFGQGVVSVAALPAGHVLAAVDLRHAEVDLTEHPSPVLPAAAALVGRSLAQPLGAGQPLRQISLRPRQWFAPGDIIQVRAVGGGYAVQGSGEALTAGLEGQPARVRTEGGKMVSGMPVGERQLEIAL